MSQRLEKLQTLLEDDPNDSFLLFALAKEFESLEEYEQAIKTLEKLRESDEKYVGLYYHLAKLYQETDQLKAAQNMYEIGVEKCREVGDQHALSELLNAKQNFEIEHL